jgi:hypothetical protein
MKLSDAQSNLLQDIMWRPRHCSTSYKPAIKLVALGYAEWIEGRYSEALKITQAGRDALAILRAHGSKADV